MRINITVRVGRFAELLRCGEWGSLKYNNRCRNLNRQRSLRNYERVKGKANLIVWKGGKTCILSYVLCALILSTI